MTVVNTVNQETIHNFKMQVIIENTRFYSQNLKKKSKIHVMSTYF